MESAVLRDFQVFLMSKMRAAGLVSDALRSLGVDVKDVPAIRDRMAATYGLDEVAIPAAVYGKILGVTVQQRTLAQPEVEGHWVGSIRREYRLPLWPEVPFVVNEHPEGYAWGWGFELPRGVAPPEDLARVQPWKWTENILVPAALRTVTLDRWSFDHDVKLTFSRSGGDVTYHAVFDYGLLQHWGVEV